MKKLFTIIFLFVGVCSYTQTLNLQTGMTFLGDKLRFDNAYDNYPRPYFHLGIGYTHTTGVNTSLTFTFDTKGILTLSSSVPIIVFKKNRNKDVFALFNNNRL